ncbi:MAG: hypothetical protein ACJ8EL_10460 [Rhizomicrobium sp.]|jgi:hypothetical protein
MVHEPGGRDVEIAEREEDEETEADQPEGRALAAPPVPAVPERYDFPLPDHIAVSDLLGIQLGEMVRVTRFLSDIAMERNQDAHERVQTIHSIDDIVGCAGKLAEYMDRTRGNFGWQDRPSRPGLSARKR